MGLIGVEFICITYFRQSVVILTGIEIVPQLCLRNGRHEQLPRANDKIDVFLTTTHRREMTVESGIEIRMTGQD
ncbi:hypothetical protein DO97_17450 [Neosynechococcus sphagnicola sy1]|uniref:Uncharacterized protein n=1 Tax=Neosynechococcus sphagnicola sy1 TaxID=1497020 RepID=A0A098TI26_9CYAN|nr:hypothetical protein DO97_17450 [Neosynechococcus sphagnicola sy1]